ncbi:hypothetical protein NESM_000786100 [Novymonas esmeraldas]|uniref:Uncharacterized protein n=1 Tax=Novymonas esmeraldas TaxID=1808958 RepID=A0AAW0EXI3_9TRYP
MVDRSSSRLPGAVPPSDASAAERAGERLFGYARVQRQARAAAVEAQRAAEAAGPFRPALSPLTTRSSPRRPPLYTSPPPRPLSPPTPAVSASGAAVPPRCWSAYLDRLAATERRRRARLRELRWRVAEDAVGDCTFRPRLAPRRSSHGTSTAVLRADSPRAALAAARLGCHAVAETQSTALLLFEADMEALRNSLLRLRSR